MEFNNLLDEISYDFNRVKADSRLAGEGDIFIAIKGTSSDGHDFAGEVLEKGALFAVCERMPENIGEKHRDRVVLVGDTKEALGDILKELFGDPSGKMRVHAVTGTNGKTTTAFLMHTILNSSGINCGLISTVFNNIEGDILTQSKMTTPDIMFVNRALSEMLKGGKKAVSLEISSHALSQKRVHGISLDSAVFTNLTPEHLDYHKNMEKYLEDKCRIFGLLKPGAPGIVNADDPMLLGIESTVKVPNLLTFGIYGERDIKAEDISFDDKGAKFRINAKKYGKFELRSGLFGVHNVYNITGAVASLLVTGVPVERIQEGIEKARPVPGRLESVESAAPFRVFIDYAHTPHALERVLQCVKDLTPGKVVCVFGCGGDRDRTKRPVMGKIASTIADSVILTSDNPRSEDPKAILAEIEKGISGRGNCKTIAEREEAIREALKIAGDGDIVLIAGKGHEDYQIIGKETRPFDDKKTAGKILKEMGY